MKVQVVKVGGQVAEDPVQLQALLKGFAAMEGPKVLVHGGGREATALAGKLGIPVQMVEGRRITDAATLEVVTMVYAGLVNKRLVAQLQALGVNAIGLIDYGFVGDVDGVNADLLASLLSSGFVPVVSPLTYDGKGSLLNTNADTIASTVATALAGQFDVTLTFCFDLEGVLDASGTVIPQIDAASFETLKTTGALTGGILPKITNALAAVKAGVGAVRIAKYDLKNPGTLIQ